MGFSLELDDETARLLHEEAARQGIDAEALGRNLVREGVRRDEGERREARGASLRVALEAVAAFGQRNPMPSLPDEALTREALYAEHP